jgi:hypothetical protein
MTSTNEIEFPVHASDYFVHDVQILNLQGKLENNNKSRCLRLQSEDSTLS